MPFQSYLPQGKVTPAVETVKVPPEIERLALTLFCTAFPSPQDLAALDVVALDMMLAPGRAR